MEYILFAGSSLATSIFSFKLTKSLIGMTYQKFINAKIVGKDLGKSDQKSIPEAVGIVCSVVYILVISLNLVLNYIIGSYYGASDQIKYKTLIVILASIWSICFASLFGFIDDVLDLKWKDKILLSFFSSIPILLIYHVMKLDTILYFPFPLGRLLGPSLDIGILYLFYLAILFVFSTNCINILSGINGLETGQSLVISISLCLYYVIELFFKNTQAYISLFMILPLIGVSSGLVHFNWYPAEVFVGDTYCYFAGAVISASAIFGGFGNSLLLFFIPQICNFIYSSPQLFRLFPCPRHRLPKYSAKYEKHKPSNFSVRIDSLPLSACVITGFMARSGFAKVNRQGPSSTHTAKIDNLTLLNAYLRKYGPENEESLCKNLLKIQAYCSVLAISTIFLVKLLIKM